MMRIFYVTAHFQAKGTNSDLQTFKTTSLLDDNYKYSLIEDFYMIFTEYLPMLTFLASLVISYLNYKKQEDAAK
jgi:hypothetical protein